MKHPQDKLTGNLMISLLTAIALLLIGSISVMAQARPKSHTEVENNRRATTQQDLLVRGAVRDDTVESASRQAILEQAKEDFEKIQSLNDNIMGIVKLNDGFNYKKIGEITAEIKKRAKRFKETTNLPPPEDETVKQKKLNEIGQAEMKDALLMLNERINSFVDNPLFRAPKWDDVKLGAKASRDLVTIIDLSGQIKKGAEKLVKDSR